MTDAERIQQLEEEVLELRAQMAFLFRQYGFTEEELLEFRHRTTMPSPPPAGVMEEGAGVSFPSAEPPG